MPSAMNTAGQVAAVASILAFVVGLGLARRSHRTTGVALLGGAVVTAFVLAASGEWRPLLAVIAIAGFFGGLTADRPGNPGKRALGLLGITIGMFALVIAGVYG